MGIGRRGGGVVSEAISQNLEKLYQMLENEIKDRRKKISFMKDHNFRREMEWEQAKVNLLQDVNSNI